MTSLAGPNRQRTSTNRRTAFWRKPFAAETWQRTAYLLLSAPIAVIDLACALAGRPATAAALRARLAVALAVVSRSNTELRPASTARTVMHGLLGIALGGLSLVITAYGLSLIVLNVAYPVRGVDDLSDSWGGPTLAGAWAVHAAAGLVFLFLVPWAVDGLVALHRRLLLTMIMKPD